MDEITNYLEDKNISYKLSDGANGKEAICKICAFCRDTKDHFYLNLEHKVFFCHKCNASGTFLTLKEKLGDLATVSTFKDLSVSKESVKSDIPIEDIEKAHAALLEDGKVLKYLHSRKFTIEAIRHFKLGLSTEDGIQWLWFPYYINDTPVNIKKKSLPPAEKMFKRVVGGKSILYNINILKEFPKDIVLVEGEADCVALWSAGLHNVVSVPNGAGGLSPEDSDELDRVSKIYIVPDHDDPGLEGAYKIANRLGIERCYHAILPYGIKDVNKFFQEKYTLEQFLSVLGTSRPFHVQYISSLGEEVSRSILKLTSKSSEEEGLHLPWKRLDKLINGFMPGDLISVAGRPGTGKTAFSINLAYYFSKMNIPTLFFELEMRPQRIIPRIVALHTGIDSDNVMQVDLLQKAYRELKEFPFLFAYVYKKPNFEFCADTIRKGYHRYGLRFVVFDNLHFLVRSVRDQTKEISITVQNFKLLAEELGIPIVLIARPRKTNNRIITNEDLKDSADIEGDSDSVILIHREPKAANEENYKGEDGNFAPETLIRVSKARYSSGGDCYLIMDDKQCRLTEV